MSDYTEFKKNIKRKTGIDLSLYKEAQMKRRLTSLKVKREFANFSCYFKELEKDPVLLEEFLQKITINVSEFFRNPERWQVLEKKILPRMLIKNKNMKVWSAACSTGEEAYSIAMLLRKKLSNSQIEVIATDLDKEILDRAKAGFYTERSLKGVPSEMLHRHFINEGAGYRIKEELQHNIQFKQDNLLSNTYETGFDLIICRNVMIYFTEEAKHELYKKFSSALKPDGVLFVGSTEQIFNPKEYQLEAEETFFYRKMN